MVRVFQKSEVVEAILAALRAEFETYVTTSRQARTSGNDAQTKAEGKYDTRSIEENYLADGMAKHALVARQALDAIAAIPVVNFTAVTPISLGALVELAFPTEALWFFLAPAAGGLEVSVDGQTITVLSPDSPLGLQLKDRRQGDSTLQPKTKILRVL
jgi:hypothetical protein